MIDRPSSEIRTSSNPRLTSGLFFVVAWRSIAVLTALSLLTALLLWVLVGPFWPRPAPLASASIGPSAADITAAQRELDRLDNKIAQLRKNLAEKRLLCKAKVVRKPPPPRPDKDEICRLCRNNITRLAGNISLSLIWQGFADIDLHLICPNGSHVFYKNRRVPQCDAFLNIDKNAHIRRLDRRPIENISIGKNAPQGKYRVEIEYFARHRTSPDIVPFKLNITRNNRSEVRTGSVHYFRNKGSNRRLVAFEFEIKPQQAIQLSGPDGIKLDCSICRNSR